MGTQPPLHKKGEGGPPIFGLCLLWPNGWMDQDATWYGGRPRRRRHCVRWGPISLPERACTAPNFRSMSIVAKRLQCIRIPLGTEVDLSLGDIVVDGKPAPPPLKGQSPRIFGQCPLWPNGWMTKMPLGMEVGLGPGDFVFDWDRAPPAQFIGPCLLWPNGWMDQDATWYGGKSRPRRRCVRWGGSSP